MLLSRLNRLPTRSADTHVNPVAFPPGRARLPRSFLSGSQLTTTIGIFSPFSFVASSTGSPAATNTSILRLPVPRGPSCRAAEQRDEVVPLDAEHGKVPPLSSRVVVGANRRAATDARLTPSQASLLKHAHVRPVPKVPRQRRTEPRDGAIHN